MNILIFTWRDIKNPSAGGSELYFHEMAKRWVKKGYKVRWITSNWKEGQKREIVEGVEVIRTGGRLTQYLFAPLAYFRYGRNSDVIIDNENGIPYFTPLFSSKKKFLHVHHSHKSVWGEEAKGEWNLYVKTMALIGYFIENYLMPLCYKNIKIITISDSSSKEIKKDFGLKIGGIVNPGFERKKIKKFKKSSNPTVFFMNRIKKYKGIEFLILAFKKVRKEIPKAELLVAGRGEALDSMKELVKKEKIRGVKFLGFVNEETKQELLEKSWVFVNPSHKEGWGIVNIEASSFGLPVIGSNVSGIRDSIKRGESGELFEYGNIEEISNKIIDILRNKKKREKLSKGGRKWSRNFSWNKAAEKYLKILKS